MHFPGIIPAVITPFTAEDAVDVAGLRANTAHVLAHGVRGLVATGTMGEAGQLSTDERRAVVEAVVAEAAGSVPVLAGVSAGSTAAAVANAVLSREAGVSGVMCLPPLNYRGRVDEYVAFYRAVAEAAGVPIMAYNNPEATGYDFTPELIAAVAAEVPEIVAVKECSGDARRIARLVNDTDLEILVGGDDWALEGFATGAVGWVSGVANVAPAECVRLQELVEQGELAEARAVYRRLLPLARLDMTPKLVQYFKGSLDAAGLHGGPVRGPRRPLDEAEQALLRSAVDALGLHATA
ncbi:MAG: dihydrodipicolinate synthase family protein [Solirubrobacterales bacterium]|jgi:4-hydroxy-tetrahydrodipicolinate synthase|nr:dihydrodipicolinate synthase family protein [Solirubrobacterales bacterium]